MKQTLSFTFALLAFSIGIRAQVRITGNIMDADSNDPLIGASIVEKGTSNGVISDIDGNFSIATQNESGVIVISFIGYLNQEFNFTGATTLNVSLEPDMISIDEVVVVGYGTQKKSHLTGSIAKLNPEGLEDIPSSRADQILQGRVAGVQIQNTTSQVGESPLISIRGTGSISANGQPLVIIDGFPNADGLSVIDIADIESMEVLKDAASAAIYGSRAANGVIIVTTKSGSEDKPKYNAKVSYAIKDAYELHPMMTGDEYTKMVLNEANQSGGTIGAQNFAISTINGDTNWQEEALRAANVLNVQFNVSGGKKGLKYYVSSSYLGDEGIMLQNKYDRFNIRSKIEADLSSKVKIGVTMASTYTKRSRPTNNFTDFARWPRWMPVYHTEQTSEATGIGVGEYAQGQIWAGTYTGIDPQTGEERTVTATPFSSSNNNPLYVMRNEFYSRKDYRMQGSAYLRLKLAKGLEFKTSNGFNTVYCVEDTYKNMNSKTTSSTNEGWYENRLFIDLLSENTLTYKFHKGKHRFDGLLGFSIQERSTETAGILGTNFPTDYIHTLNAAGVIAQYDGDNQATGTWVEEESLVSVFSRFAYSYADKYLMSASFRGDGSSKFGADNRWGYFPSVSLGWRISEEAFFRDNINQVDQLKLRASYGVTGTDDIINYSNTNMLTSNNYVLGTGTGTINAGLSNTSDVLGNSMLQWEQTDEFNYGIDLITINNRINLGIDYYYAITKSLLYERSINSILGFTKAWSNEGKVRNKGLEVVLTTQNINQNDLKWSTTLNFSYNRNKVLDLGGPEFLLNSGEKRDEYITRVGEPLLQFYGYKTDGVWASQAEIDANPSHSSATPGGLRIVDANGDDKIDTDDLTVIGNPFPDFNWGITNHLSYKDFDLSFLIQGIVGSELINADLDYNNTLRYNKNYNTGRWVNENYVGDGYTPFMKNGIDQMTTDYAVEDADYLALRDLTIGYTLPKSVLQKANLSKVRIYLSGQNLLYWWSDDYRGINPEARRTSSQYTSPLIDGYQRGAFPVQRTYSVGVDISF